MPAYLQYLSNRYLNEKGQGMVEYAVVVAVVIAIGVALLATGGGSISGYITDIFKSILRIDKMAPP